MKLGLDWDIIQEEEDFLKVLKRYILKFIYIGLLLFICYIISFNIEWTNIRRVWCLTPLSIILQWYLDGQFYLRRKSEYLEKTTDLLQVTDKDDLSNILVIFVYMTVKLIGYFTSQIIMHCCDVTVRNFQSGHNCKTLNWLRWFMKYFW